MRTWRKGGNKGAENDELSRGGRKGGQKSIGSRASWGGGVYIEGKEERCTEDKG